MCIDEGSKPEGAVRQALRIVHDACDGRSTIASDVAGVTALPELTAEDVTKGEASRGQERSEEATE